MEKDYIPLRLVGIKTDAALIPLLNSEWLEPRVGFPEREQPRLKFGAVHGRLADKLAICETSRTKAGLFF